MPETAIRHDWTPAEIQAIYNQPMLELVYQAARTHRQYHDPRYIQVCCLISVKTGGCPENCKYCAQSAHNPTDLPAQPMLSLEEVLARAKQMIAKGATRICLGAAWREVRPNKPFDSILQMVEQLSAMGVEVCCTLGMLDKPAAEKLASAGIYAYNHNLDTSAEFYQQVVTTRTYEERLATLDVVEQAGISVCCGGILGLGESEADRISLLHTLATRPHHPESVPINMLWQIPGTPLAQQANVPFWQLLRMIATTRLVMPRAMVRLSCGRQRLSAVEQAMCFMAGANSIHSGELLLTVPTPAFDADDELLQLLGLQKLPPYQQTTCETTCCPP